MQEEPTTTTNNYGYPYAGNKAANGFWNPDYLGQGVRGPLWAIMGTAVGATALYALNTLFRGFGPNGGPGGPGNGGPYQFATQRDLTYERELTTKDAEIGKLQAQLYTDQQVNALRQELTAATAAQAVVNANQTGALALVQAQAAQLQQMTALYIRQPVLAASEGALNFVPPALAAAAANKTATAGTAA